MKKPIVGIVALGIMYAVIYLSMIILQMTYDICNIWVAFVINIFLITVLVIIIEKIVRKIDKLNSNDKDLPK